MRQANRVGVSDSSKHAEKMNLPVSFHNEPQTTIAPNHRQTAASGNDSQCGNPPPDDTQTQVGLRQSGQAAQVDGLGFRAPGQGRRIRGLLSAGWFVARVHSNYGERWAIVQNWTARYLNAEGEWSRPYEAMIFHDPADARRHAQEHAR